MNRYVIKGRGPNRGKYLCYARIAPEIKPTEDGFVWLPEQRKAARWEDPRYRDQTWGTDRARIHDGYFVRLVAPAAVIAAVDELKAFVVEHAVETATEYACWVHGATELSGIDCDEGTNFCFDCCTAKVAAIRKAHPKEARRVNICIDGGFGTDHDSTPFCETCGIKLLGSQTGYCTDEEIAALTDYAAPDWNDGTGWQALYDATSNIGDDDPRWRRIAKVVEAARAAEREHSAAAQAALAATPGMTGARSHFISLLYARVEQKAPEPSYRLWDELLRYVAIPFNRRRRPRIAAWERRLIKEAEIFVSCLGYQWCGDCVEAPYGIYYWTWVVQVEQERLWGRPPFLEGLAAGAPDSTARRDENPYTETADHRGWDCGFMAAFKVAKQRGS